MQKSGIMAHILALAHIVPTSGVPKPTFLAFCWVNNEHTQLWSKWFKWSINVINFCIYDTHTYNRRCIYFTHHEHVPETTLWHQHYVLLISHSIYCHIAVNLYGNVYFRRLFHTNKYILPLGFWISLSWSYIFVIWFDHLMCWYKLITMVILLSRTFSWKNFTYCRLELLNSLEQSHHVLTN